MWLRDFLSFPNLIYLRINTASQIRSKRACHQNISHKLSFWNFGYNLPPGIKCCYNFLQEPQKLFPLHSFHEYEELLTFFFCKTIKRVFRAFRFQKYWQEVLSVLCSKYRFCSLCGIFKYWNRIPKCKEMLIHLNSYGWHLLSWCGHPCTIRNTF